MPGIPLTLPGKIPKVMKLMLKIISEILIIHRRDTNPTGRIKLVMNFFLSSVRVEFIVRFYLLLLFLISFRRYTMQPTNTTQPMPNLTTIRQKHQ